MNQTGEVIEVLHSCGHTDTIDLNSTMYVRFFKGMKKEDVIALVQEGPCVECFKKVFCEGCTEGARLCRCAQTSCK